MHGFWKWQDWGYATLFYVMLRHSMLDYVKLFYVYLRIFTYDARQLGRLFFGPSPRRVMEWSFMIGVKKGNIKH